MAPLVGEVVRVDEHRPAGRRELAAGVLVAADQLLLLGVDADQRLLGRQRPSGRRGDVIELGVTVGVVGPLM